MGNSQSKDPKIRIGEKYGIYLIEDVLPEKDKYGHWIYKCICQECGYVKYTHYGNLSGKNCATQCKHLNVQGQYITYNNKWTNKRLRKIFQEMRRRCYNSNSKDYKWYGAKGIKICSEWINTPESFEQWALNHGYNDTLTLDRIDSNKDYEPSNCRWITLKENCQRAGKVTWIEIDGIVKTGREWSDYLNIGTNTINTLIREYGLELTIQLMKKMLKDSPSNKHRQSHQTWFSVYGIQV